MANYWSMHWLSGFREKRKGLLGLIDVSLDAQMRNLTGCIGKNLYGFFLLAKKSGGVKFHPDFAAFSRSNHFFAGFRHRAPAACFNALNFQSGTAGVGKSKAPGHLLPDRDFAEIMGGCFKPDLRAIRLSAFLVAGGAGNKAQEHQAH